MTDWLGFYGLDTSDEVNTMSPEMRQDFLVALGYDKVLQAYKCGSGIPVGRILEPKAIDKLQRLRRERAKKASGGSKKGQSKTMAEPPVLQSVSVYVQVMDGK